jgi:hypothetical protein
VAQSGKPYPLRLQRNGDGVRDILGFLEYGDYDAKVTVTAPSPTVDLASVTG